MQSKRRIVNSPSRRFTRMFHAAVAEGSSPRVRDAPVSLFNQTFFSPSLCFVLIVQLIKAHPKREDGTQILVIVLCSIVWIVSGTFSQYVLRAVVFRFEYCETIHSEQ